MTTGLCPPAKLTEKSAGDKVEDSTAISAATDDTVPSEPSTKNKKLFPAESVSGTALTENTESSALAGWPARKIGGFIPNGTRPAVWARAGAVNDTSRSNGKPNVGAGKDPTFGMVTFDFPAVH